jgi:hypothetical protein
MIIADLLTGKTPSFDIHHFRPERFLEGGVTWSNPFTAGEHSNEIGAVPV